MKYFLLFLLTALIFTACEKSPRKPLPICIDFKVKQLRADRNWEGGVYSYTYKGETVYYFGESGCCDLMSTLLDAKCNVICGPDGGFSGHGDGKCPDFHAEKSDERLIWKRK